MDRLHRDLREVFERQQARMGSLAGVRERVMRDALAREEPRRRPLRLTAGLAGGLVAILLAAALVGTLVLSRERARPPGGPAATPVATPTPAPVPSATPLHATQPLRAAAADPVLLFRDPTDHSQLDGVTWDGKSLGRVGPASQRALFTSPTGSLYASDQQVYDRSGTPVGPIDLSRVSSMAWADDGRHYCRLDHASTLPPAGGEPATLRVAAPGEAARTVAQLGTVGQEFGVGVAACSVTHDRAVVVQAGGQGTSSTRMWVVQLSDGRVLWSKSFANDGITITHVVAAPDGQTVAEVSYRCCQGDRPSPPATTVYDAAGRAVAHLDGAVAGFSWDGSLAVVSADGATPDAAQVTVSRWRDGSVVWTAPAGLAVTGVAAEPGGQRLAIGLQSQAAQPNQSGFPSADVYAVGPDGRALLLLRAVPF
jgi:hypothetical protein